MKAKAKTKKETRNVTFKECTFNASRDDIVALAKALEANAVAIQKVAESIRQSHPMIVIGDS